MRDNQTLKQGYYKQKCSPTHTATPSGLEEIAVSPNTKTYIHTKSGNMRKQINMFPMKDQD